MGFLYYFDRFFSERYLHERDYCNAPLEKRVHYTCVCRLAQPLNGGYKEIISRIRKHTNARTLGKLATEQQTGIEIWQNLLFNYS